METLRKLTEGEKEKEGEVREGGREKEGEKKNSLLEGVAREGDGTARDKS